MTQAGLTIGVIGCGSVAENAYMPLAVNLMAKGKIKSVVFYDQKQERAEKLKNKFTNTTAAKSIDDLLGNPEVDAVLILTSMNEHGDLATKSLQAGKHVLVEKPMATTLERAEELIKVSKQVNKVLVCAPHVLLSPDYQEMHRRISSGQIGKPLLARARYGWDGPDWGKWFYAPGGGPLFDLGVYNVTSLTGLLGPARRVTCMSSLTRPERVVEGESIKVQTDDTFQIVIEHESGALSTVTTAFGMQKYRGAALEVYGLAGTIQMMGDDWAPDGLELWLNELGAWQMIDSASRYWPWTDGLSHLVDCVLEGKPSYTTPEHAYHVLEIMLGCMKAAETGMAQEIKSTFVPPKAQEKNRNRDSHRIHDRVHEDAQ